MTNDQTQNPRTLPDLAIQVVRSMLNQDELKRVWCDDVPPPTESAGRWVHVEVVDELWDFPLLDPEQFGKDHSLSELASSLQDAIAESGFAWGQLRWPDPAVVPGMPGQREPS